MLTDNSTIIATVPEQLREHFLKQFQYRNPAEFDQDPHAPIRIDDCSTSDITDWKISVLIPSDLEMFLLWLENVPYNQALEKLVEKKGGRITHKLDDQVRIQIPIQIRDVTWLRRLEKSIRNVTGKGQRYDIPIWKWMTRRVGDSLENLANHLKAFKPRRS